VLLVESSDGDSVGVITSRAELDAVIAALNRRGPREAALHVVSLFVSLLSEGGQGGCVSVCCAGRDAAI
jgi:hypothetical protein